MAGKMAGKIDNGCLKGAGHLIEVKIEKLSSGL